MKRQVFTLLGLMALACGLVAAAEIDGKWTAAGQSKHGTITETLIVKSNGNKLTGTIQRHRGPEEISEGIVSGSAVSFKVKRESKKKKEEVIQQYKGTLSGGQLKLTFSGRDGASKELVFKKAGS